MLLFGMDAYPLEFKIIVIENFLWKGKRKILETS